MRTLIIIFLILIIVVLFVRMAVGNIEIDVKLSSFSIKGLAASLIQKKPTIKVGASITVHNANFFEIPVSDLNIDIYDGETLIARSVGTSKNLLIPREKSETFNHSFDVFISSLLLDKIEKIQSGQKIKFTYSIKGRIFGIPVKFKNQYNSLI